MTTHSNAGTGGKSDGDDERVRQQLALINVTCVDEWPLELTIEYWDGGSPEITCGALAPGGVWGRKCTVITTYDATVTLAELRRTVTQHLATAEHIRLDRDDHGGWIQVRAEDSA